MKKGKIAFVGLVAAIGISLAACNKCMECHYEKNGDDIELPGEYCGDEIEEMEANGHTDTSGTYPAHCGEH